MICTICGCEAEYRFDEQCWRHKGKPWELEFSAQALCDKYGYPVKVKNQTEKEN